MGVVALVFRTIVRRRWPSLAFGVVLGRLIWNTTSHSLGVLDAFTIPVGKLALVLLGAVAVAAVVALAAAWRPARSTIASGLRTE